VVAKRWSPIAAVTSGSCGDLDALAELVATALVAAVVAELATGVPSSPRRPGGGRRAHRGGQAVVADRGGGDAVLPAAVSGSGGGGGVRRAGRH
jgi:hypothetical protein